MALQVMTTGMASVFAGGATYTAIVQRPATLQLQDLHYQLFLFQKMYRHAAIVQTTLAIGSGISGILIYFLTNQRLWLSSSILILSVPVYTAVAMFSTNRLLCDTAACKRKGKQYTQNLLQKWHKLHRGRTLISLTSMGVFMYALAHSQR